jgi:hypothetical protein
MIRKERQALSNIRKILDDYQNSSLKCCYDAIKDIDKELEKCRI